MKLGEIIKVFRKKNKMTMQEFADRAGLSKGYISMLERSQHPQSQRKLVPSFETYLKVANAMSMSIDELVALLDDNETVRLNESSSSSSDVTDFSSSENHGEGMCELEKQVKDIIIAKYGSLKRFCEEVDMPWSTLDSILKRGFANSNIGNVLKVARELDIEVEPLTFGVLQKRVPTPADPLQLTEQEKHIISIYHDLDRVGQEKFTAFGEGLLAAARADDRRGYYTFTPYGNCMVAESGPEYQMWSNKVNDQLMEDADRIAKKEIENASNTKKMVK